MVVLPDKWIVDEPLPYLTEHVNGFGFIGWTVGNQKIEKIQTKKGHLYEQDTETHLFCQDESWLCYYCGVATETNVYWAILCWNWKKMCHRIFQYSCVIGKMGFNIFQPTSPYKACSNHIMPVYFLSLKCNFLLLRIVSCFDCLYLVGERCKIT